MAPFVRPQYPFYKKCFLALQSMGYALYSQPHMRAHFVSAALAVALALYFQIRPLEWMALVLSIGGVWIAEILNTAIELMVDLQTKQRKMRAKLSKDLGSAAVLIASVQALVVGYLIFFDRLVTLLV